MMKKTTLLLLILSAATRVFGQFYSFDQSVVCGNINQNPPYEYYDERYVYEEGQSIFSWCHFVGITDYNLEVRHEWYAVSNPNSPIWTYQNGYSCCGEIFSTSLFPFNLATAGDYFVKIKARSIGPALPGEYVSTHYFSVTNSVTVKVSALKHDEGFWDLDHPFFLTELTAANAPFELVQVASDGSPATLVEIKRSGPTAYKVFPTSDPTGVQADVYGSFEKIGEDNETILFQYKSPTYLVPGFLVHCTVQSEETGTNALNFTFKTVRPPVVLLHGLTPRLGNGLGGSEKMLALKSYLMSSAYHDFHPGYVQTPDYNGKASFTSSYPVLSTFINNTLEAARVEDKVSAGKADVVGYSMGGLVSRMYLQSGLYHDNINKLITLNTPHSGSEMANNPLAYLFSYILNAPAIRDLSTASTAIKSKLNGASLNAHIVPSHAVTSAAADVVSGLDLLDYCQYNNTFFDQIKCHLGNHFDFYCSASSLQNCIFHGEPNDDVVSVASQEGGLAANTSVGNQVRHSDVTDVLQTAITLDNLLGANASSGVFSTAGFHPPLINFTAENVESRGGMSIKILEPLDGAIVAAGQAVNISMEGSPNVSKILALENVVDRDTVYSQEFAGSSANFSVTIPAGVSGLYRIGVLGKSADDLFAIDTITLNIQGAVSIQHVEEEHTSPYKLYPNPTAQRFYFQNLDDHQVIHGSVYSMAGNKMHDFDVAPQATYQNPKTLAPGVYVIKLQIANQLITERFIQL